MILPTLLVIMETARTTALHDTELGTAFSGLSRINVREIGDMSKAKEEELMYAEACEDAEEEDALSDDSLRLRLSDDDEAEPDEASAFGAGDDQAASYLNLQQTNSQNKAIDVKSTTQEVNCERQESSIPEDKSSARRTCESVFDKGTPESKIIKQEEPLSGNVSADSNSMNNNPFHDIDGEDMNMWHGRGRRGHPPANYSPSPGWSVQENQRRLPNSSRGRSYHNERVSRGGRGTYRNNDQYQQTGKFYNSGDSDFYQNRYYNNFVHYGRGRSSTKGNYGQYFREHYSRDGKQNTSERRDKWSSSGTNFPGRERGSQSKAGSENRDMCQIESTTREPHTKLDKSTVANSNCAKTPKSDSAVCKERDSKSSIKRVNEKGSQDNLKIDDSSHKDLSGVETETLIPAVEVKTENVSLNAEDYDMDYNDEPASEVSDSVHEDQNQSRMEQSVSNSHPECQCKYSIRNKSTLDRNSVKSGGKDGSVPALGELPVNVNINECRCFHNNQIEMKVETDCGKSSTEKRGSYALNEPSVNANSNKVDSSKVVDETDGSDSMARTDRCSKENVLEKESEREEHEKLVEPPSNVEDKTISPSELAEESSELKSTHEKSNATLISVPTNETNDLDSPVTVEQSEHIDAELKNDTEVGLDNSPKTARIPDIQKQPVDIDETCGKELPPHDTEKQDPVETTMPNSVDEAENQSSSIQSEEKEESKSTNELEPGSVLKNTAPSDLIDSESSDERLCKELKEKNQNVDDCAQEEKGRHAAESSCSVDTEKINFNETEKVDHDCSNQVKTVSIEDSNQGEKYCGEQDKETSIDGRNSSTEKIEQIENIVSSREEISNSATENIESVSKSKTDETTIDDAGSVKTGNKDATESIRNDEENKESSGNPDETGNTLLITSSKKSTETTPLEDKKSGDADNVRLTELCEQEESRQSIDSLLSADNGNTSDSQSLKSLSQKNDKTKNKLRKRRTRRIESDISSNGDDMERPNKLQKQEVLPVQEKSSMTKTNSKLTNGTDDEPHGSLFNLLLPNEDMKKTQTVDGSTPRTKVANSGANQTMVSADATASKVEGTTSKPTASTKKVTDDSDTENEPLASLERKRRKTKRKYSSREATAEELPVKATENVRQKRKTAKNAEVIIRNKFMNDSDLESSDSSGKFVALKSSSKSKIVRTISPPALKRSCPDEDPAVGSNIVTKKVKVGPLSAHAEWAKKVSQENQEEPKTLNYVRKFFRRDAKDKLAKLKPEELEELLIQKLVETITMRGEIGRLREQARISERNQEASRIRCQQLAKQIKDFEMVLNRNAVDRRGNNDKPVPPIKINRSVGLQVNFTTEQGMQNLRQLHGLPPPKTPTPSSTVINGANLPFYENSENTPGPRRGIKVRSPRRPEAPSTASPATVQAPAQPQPQTQTQTQASPVTPAALVVAKSVESPQTPNLLSHNTTLPQLLPKVNIAQPAVKQQAVIINGKISSPTNRNPSILNIQKTKPNDLIDLTDEEDKTKTSASTNVTTPLCTVATTQAGTPKIQPRFQRVVQTIPGNLAITTQAASIRVVQPSSLPTPTALVNNMNAPRLAYVMQDTPGSGRRLLITSNSQIRPVVSTARPQFPGLTYKTGISTLANGTVRVLTTSASPNLQISKHPAPLPETPQYPVHPTGKLPPPPPSLKISKVTHGIVLSWNMALSDKYAAISTYQLYAYQEITGVPANTNLWKKVGDVDSLALPMACTLTQFSEGNNYHFAVRAVDVHSRFGPYSAPGHISL